MCSAKAETPRWWWSGSPSASCQRRSPDSSVPAAFAAAPGSHSAARPPGTARSRRRLGTKASTTWSPAAKPSTPGPTSTTSPAASWPSTIGITRGREPSITDRSEWHRPAARTRTSSSPGPGGSSSSSVDLERPRLGVGRGAGPSRAGRRRGPSCRVLRRLDQALERGRARRRGSARGGASRGRRTRARTSPSAAGSSGPSREEADLVAHARACRACPTRSPASTVSGKASGAVEVAVRLGAQPDRPRRAWMSSPPSRISQALITVSKNA